MDIRTIHKELLPEIQAELLLVAKGYPVREIGESFERLSSLFQALGICHVLETGNTDQFRENLMRSAYSRRYFLQKSAQESNLEDAHLSLGRTEAFLDSVVAGHHGLAGEIARLSTARWNANWEYEDDFCFFQFLHHVILAGGTISAREADSLLIRFESALEGAKSSRLDVCLALAEKSRNGFRKALTSLLEQRQEQSKADRERALEADETTFLVWPRSFVCVEGLALLSLAQFAGIGVDEDFPLCPKVCRLEPIERQYPDPFTSIESRLT